MITIRPPLLRFHRRRTTAASLLVVALVAVGSAGCTGSSDDKNGKDAARGDVDITTVLDTQIVKAGIIADPGSLHCGDAKLTEGATITCTYTSNAQPVGLTAKVASVDGSSLGLKVATTAKPVPADVLGNDVAVQAGKQLGAAIDGATCSGDLQAKVGQSTTCTLTSGSQTSEVTATVSSLDGGQINYTVSGAQ